MKKLLLATLLAAGALLPTTAQDLYLTYKGQPVPDGGTVVYEGYKAVTFEDIPGMTLWTVDPELYIVSTSDASVTAEVTSNISVQLCTSLNGEAGECIRGTELKKSPITLQANDPRNLLLDQEFRSFGQEDYEIPQFDIVVKLWNNSTPSEVYSINLKMGGFTAGVEELGGEGNMIEFKGNSLSYDLPAGSQISLYSLSGKTVLTQNVAGSGSINLDGLAKGVYIYRVSGKYPKAAKIIIK